MNSVERYEATAHVGAARKCITPYASVVHWANISQGVRNCVSDFMPWDHTIYQWYIILTILDPSILCWKELEEVLL